MSNFKVGQKVVCVKSNPRQYDEAEDYYGVRFPVVKEMYTIREMELIDKVLCFHFEELVNPKIQYLDGYDEVWFKNECFRPLDHAFADSIEAMIKKSLVTAFLLFGFMCYSQDTICLTKPEYERVYNGLKQGEVYKQRSTQYLNTALRLNDLIQANNDSLQNSLKVISGLNAALYVKQDELLKATAKPKWYEKWYLWLGLGIIGGFTAAQ